MLKGGDHAPARSGARWGFFVLWAPAGYHSPTLAPYEDRDKVNLIPSSRG